MNKKLLGIIPARGGSKRIKNKNIRHFCGKPILAYTILAAQESNIFDHIHVSTNDSNILETAKNYGVKTDFLRSEELSDDNTALFPVLRYVIDCYEQRNIYFDHVALLMPTMPLVTGELLAKAYRHFVSKNTDLPLLAVTPYDAPIESSYILGSDGKLIPQNPDLFEMRSQDLVPKYHDAGCFVFYTCEYIKSKEDRMASCYDFMGYPISREIATDINTEEDWTFAEMLYYAKQNMR